MTTANAEHLTDAERFMQSYDYVWADFDADRLEEVGNPDATIFHSGMDRPIKGSEEPAYIRAVKSIMPDVSLEVRNWAARENVVFIEYAIGGTLPNGKRLEWEGIGRFTLDGDKAVDVVGRWDTMELWAALDPSLKRGSFLRAALDAGSEEAG